MRITDWTIPARALKSGSKVPRLHGYVDAVTDDGRILWLNAPAQNRRHFERAEFYEAWATEDRNGFMKFQKVREHRTAIHLGLSRRAPQAGLRNTAQSQGDINKEKQSWQES